MKIEINIPKYMSEEGLQLEWENNSLEDDSIDLVIERDDFI